MSGIEVLGLVAGALTTLSFIPQVIKTWKSRSAKGLSLGMFSVMCIGLSLWLIYGIIVSSVSIILTNAVTLALALSLLFFKFSFKN